MASLAQPVILEPASILENSGNPSVRMMALSAGVSGGISGRLLLCAGRMAIML